MFLRYYLIPAIFLIIPIHVATAFDLSINGYYKSFFVAYDAPSIEPPYAFPDEPLLGQVANRIRLNLSYRLNDRLSADFSYNLLPRVQDPSLFGTPSNLSGFDFPDYRVADLDFRLYPDDDEETGSFGLFQNLDRAALTLTTPVADLLLGRQAIAWGSGRVVNPTDILNPFTFDELDAENRLGVDAVRVRVPVGRLEEIDAGYVFGDDFKFDESAFFLRAKLYAFNTDISPILIGFRENLLLGLDLSRSLGGASGWLEAGYVFVDAFDGEGDCSEDGYFRATIGADRALTGELYGFIEYHFSRAGSGDPEEYVDLLSKPAFTDGAVYLLGRHYLIPGFTYQITPLLGLGSQFIMNLGDPSLLIAPYLEYNIAEDVYLAGGAFVGIGRRPEGDPGVNPEYTIRLRSEFGGYSDLYYSSFRFYF